MGTWAARCGHQRPELPLIRPTDAEGASAVVSSGSSSAGAKLEQRRYAKAADLPTSGFLFVART
jgi:hypothetical protein